MLVPVLHTFAEVADVMPAITQVEPSPTRIGPPESPEHTELDGGANNVSMTVLVTFEMFVLPARSVEGALFWSRPHPTRIAGSDDRASRLVRIANGVRGSGSAIVITATSKLLGVLKT